jgi:isopenicillin-N epimerase
MAANHDAAVAARDRLGDALQVDPPAPDAMLGSMASLPLPIDRADAERAARLQRSLSVARVEAPIVPWPVRAARPDGRPEAWLVRVSMQAYDDMDDVERLVEALGRGLQGG